jgi:DDE family transposase
VVVADQGYYHGAEIKRCLDARLTPLVPRPRTSANEARGLFTKDDFVYDPVAATYRCPAGETLTSGSTTVEFGRTIQNYRTSACGRCALKPSYTRNKDGRKIRRWVDEHLLEAMAQRLGRDSALFAQRKALAEHPFGTMKRGMDQGYVLLKGCGRCAASSASPCSPTTSSGCSTSWACRGCWRRSRKGAHPPFFPVYAHPDRPGQLWTAPTDPSPALHWTTAVTRAAWAIPVQSPGVFTRPLRGLGGVATGSRAGVPKSAPSPHCLPRP